MITSVNEAAAVLLKGKIMSHTVIRAHFSFCMPGL
jgi:hypothetical protein